MEIFKSIKEVEESKIHPKFKLLRDEIQLSSEKRMLESWTKGLIDKDNEAVREFQESFHSRFWEFYLFKLLTNAGFIIDQGHQVPDYIVTSPYKFYIEAVVSNIREGGKKEKDRTIDDQYDSLLPPYLYSSFYTDLDESITRHSSSLQKKLKKYHDVYIKRPWVDENVPYVVALSSYDQINYGREYIYSMAALLYGAYFEVDSDNFTKRNSIIKPGTESELPLGLFVEDKYKDEYSDISAVLFSCTTTLGKLTSLTISAGYPSPNTVYTIRKCEDKYLAQQVSQDNPELLEDGIFVFHNPNAKNPLDESAFSRIPITQFWFENNALQISGNMSPIMARHNTSILFANIAWSHLQECVRLYNRIEPRDFYEDFDMLKVEKQFSIKQLIEEEKFCVVADTNILLNIYRYSPDFSAFAMDCLERVKDAVYLPSIVRYEYGKHCRGAYAKMSTRINDVKANITRQIDNAEKSIISAVDELKRKQYPDVDELKNQIKSKLDELKRTPERFFDDRGVIDYTSHSWDEDILMKYVDDIEKQGHIMTEISLKDIYEWDEQGEKRYKDEIPPGYKDAKNKKGVRQYSDLFLWNEILRFAKNKKKDVIFVTDDVKDDWWIRINGQMTLRPELLLEFSKTGQRIVPLTSEDFYDELSDAYEVERIDAVELALNMTDDEYGAQVEDRVFDSVSGKLYYSAIDYIDEESAHIGTEGIEEYEITNYEFLGAERSERDGSAFTYIFSFRVVIEGTSYDYWGRDDDTKEIIKSLGRDHVFEGDIYVEVERAADIFIDPEDADFDSARIIGGALEETSYEDKDDGTTEIERGELGNCPDCGVALSIDNDGGNGFCINCAENH
nr:PIN domain-containing protein [uncultured Butyrivibrio sp.]